MSQQDDSIKAFTECARTWSAFFTECKDQGLTAHEAIALSGQFMRAFMCTGARGKEPDLEDLFDRIVITGKKQ